MLLIPAIDLKEGKCVRLRQGQMDAVTRYSDDPLATAGRWVDAGCQRLHIVDLDGAVSGHMVNMRIIERIAQTYQNIPIQVGGGIRDEAAIKTYLDAGVQFVILGSKAVTAPHFVAEACVKFCGHIIVGLDAKDEKIAIEGWTKLSPHSPLELSMQFEKAGIEAIVYTDIRRDGMMTGINIDSTVALAQAVSVPIIASGGVSNLSDISSLLKVADAGISGIIIGRALYEGTLDIVAAQQLVERHAAAN